MGLESFKERAREVIQEVQVLTDPMSELPDGQWRESVELSADEQRDVGGLGTVRLNGEVEAALTLTRRHAAPDDLDAIDPDPEETDNAIASATLVAEAGADLSLQQPIATGAGVTLGADAAGRLAVGQHRRYPLSDSGLSALRDLLSNVRNPYSVDSLQGLVAGELFGIELSGHGQLSVTAGWQTGIVRSFEGTKLEELIPGNLGGFTANVTAGFTAQARIEGEMRVLVDRSPRDAEQVRVRLFRKKGNFLGAGLSLTVDIKLTQAEEFVASAFDRILRLPDGLVGRLEELLDELDDIQQRLDGLEQEAREAIAEVADTVADALGLDHLPAIRERLEELPAAVRALVEPILERLEAIQGSIDDGREELVEFVDDAFAQLDEPLGDLKATLESWINGYRQARQRALEFVQERAREGVTAELRAGVNRTRTSEALLELDFVLAETGLLCIEAMKGNFSPALEQAKKPGASGVEIVSGFLKETTKNSRFYNLRFNLFGFELKVNFQRWSEVVVETDARTGVLSIAGRSQALLSAETKRRRETLNFLFDAYGAFEQRGDQILTSAQTEFRARLIRSAEFGKAAQFKPLFRRHLQGAFRLGLLDVVRRAELLAALRGNTSSRYAYEIDIAFPPSAIARMFSLDRAESAKRLRPQLWDWMGQAIAILDVPLDRNRPEAMLSDFVIPSVIDAVAKKPMFRPNQRVPRAIRAVRPGGRSLKQGAYRRVWAYLRNAHFFIGKYLEVRQQLRQQIPLEEATQNLTQIAAASVSGAAALNRQPFDAKYLMLVLAEGLRETEISMTFRRGSVDVTV